MDLSKELGRVCWKNKQFGYVGHGPSTRMCDAIEEVRSKNIPGAASVYWAERVGPLIPPLDMWHEITCRSRDN